MLLPWFDRKDVTAYALVAALGGLVITGSPAQLRAGRKLNAAVGSEKITASSVTFKLARKVNAATGGIKINGTSASLRAGRRLLSATGTEKITGKAASLRVGRKVAAGVGAEVLNGAPVTFAYHPSTRVLDASPGALTLTGTSASLRAGRELSAQAGAEQINGIAADLVYTQSGHAPLLAAPGTLYLFGSAATLTYTAIVPPPEPVAHLWGTPNRGRLIARFPYARYALDVAPGKYGVRGVAAELIVRRNENEEALLLALLT